MPRTQEELNRAMKENYGTRCHILGFTGTPLLKKDKRCPSLQRNLRFLSFPLYRFEEAVGDHVCTRLRYEARYIEQQS